MSSILFLKQQGVILQIKKLLHKTGAFTLFQNNYSEILPGTTTPPFKFFL